MLRNVLIFHSGALGDFLLTWPLALALGRVLPQSRVFYVTHRQKGLLAEKVLRVESTDVEAGWHPLFGEGAALPAPAGKLLSGAQWIFSFVAGADSTWTRNVKRLAPAAQVVSLSQAAPGDFPGHQVDYLIEQLTPWPVWHEAVDQMRRAIDSRGVGGSPSGIDPATTAPVLHPGSGSPHKCWPHYLDLARRLSATARRPRVILGEVETERWTPQQIDAFAEVADIQRPPDLLGLLEALRAATHFIGNDSGPAHLAGMLALPTLSLFGPTDPARWHPLGPRVTILRKMPLETLSVDEALAAIK